MPVCIVCEDVTLLCSGKEGLSKTAPGRLDGEVPCYPLKVVGLSCISTPASLESQVRCANWADALFIPKDTEQYCSL